MKRILAYSFCVLLLAGGGGLLAVDKKKKTDTAKVVAPPTDSAKVDTAKPPKKYDDFIDTNGNGIDDRKENLKKKPAPEPKDPGSSKVKKRVSG
jgi:hypothetical protein